MILLAPHIAAFLQQRLPIERRASPNTCDSYAYAFRLLFEYASVCLKLPPSQLQLEQLDAPLIVNFLNHLETSRGNGAGSRNIRLAAIKSFMHYMEYRVPSALEQIQRILAIPAKKTDTRLVRHLTAQEMQSILDAPDPTVRDGIRDRAMLHLCFAGGLRVSELVGLRMEDMMLQPQASVLIQCRDAASDNTPTLARKRLHPHSMRHSTAVALLKSGVDLSTISHMLGHASPTTTNRYAKVDLEMKRKAIAKVTPVSRKSRTPWAKDGTILDWLESL